MAGPTAAALSRPTPKTHSWKWAAGWVGVGLGLAVGIAGVATGIAGLREQSEFEELCPSGACPTEAARTKAAEVKASLEERALVADILIPTGAVLLVAGGVGLLLEALGAEKPRVGLFPVVSAEAGSIVLRGRF
jgi:hypothetical protein